MDNLTTALMLLAGLALFLFGMNQLEGGVRVLGYDAFKRWVSRSTASPARSAGLGVLITAILQSSSMVSLLVLAFASAGVLPLYNAVGVILGANLGTTVTGWMVASIGFKLSLSTFALPLMALGALGQLLSERFASALGVGRALFGLGLIIFGLDIMKDAVAALPESLDIRLLQGHGALIYFLAGALLAAFIQSSSATMMLTLAGLHGGLLELPAAAAVVIGADLGTTSTTAIGSIGGHAIKRQLALGHFIFNLLVDSAALILLLPMLPAILAWIGLGDPLYGLVMFHTLFNLIGLAVFMPLLKPYTHWLARWFAREEEQGPVLAHLSTSVPEAALSATKALLDLMRFDTVVLTLNEFYLRPEHLQLPAAVEVFLLRHYEQRLSVPDRYALLKSRESELLAFSLEIQKQPLNEQQASTLNRQLREARALVYSSKTQMDIRKNVAAMRHTDKPELLSLYKFHRKYACSLYRRYLNMSFAEHVPAVNAERLQKWLRENDEHYDESNKVTRQLAVSGTISGVQLSSVLNVNRDIHHSVKDLLHGRGDP